MTDNCFLCLNTCTISRCVFCSIKAHKECWKTYTDNIEQKIHSLPYIDIYTLGLCPICKQVPTDKKNIVGTIMTKTHAIVTHHLHEIKNHNTENKIDIYKKFFEYMECNMWFICNNKRLEEFICKELKKLYFIDNLEFGKEIYNRMFELIHEPI